MRLWNYSFVLALALTACGPAVPGVKLPVEPSKNSDSVELFDEMSPDDIASAIESGLIPTDKTEESFEDAFPMSVQVQKEDVVEKLQPVDVEIRIYRKNPKKKIDLKKNPNAITVEHMDVYYHGERIYTWLVSAGCNCMKYPTRGAPYIASTRPGTYKIWTVSRYHRSSVFGNAKMHFAMFFDGGRAMHATYGANLKILGKPASGGCVRLAEENAATLWDLAVVKSKRNARVIVSDMQDKLEMFPLGPVAPVVPAPVTVGVR